MGLFGRLYLNGRNRTKGHKCQPFGYGCFRSVAECAGYVRDALVYASAAQPDFYPLTKFLNDAISRVPFDVTKESASEEQKRRESYKSYKGGRYYNYSHELRPETFEKDKYSV